MRRIISFMHISLDGFVAGPNGEMNWIKVDEEIFNHVGQRISKGDTALYGRVTYQMMESYWPNAGDKPNATRHDKEHSRWYGKVRKIVLSNTLNEAILTNTVVVNSNLTDTLNKVKQRGDSEILLFGSPRATHSLMQLNLIDGYWLFVNPIVLGRGIPLFQGIKDKSKLKLLSARSFASGVVELSYVSEK